MRFAKSWLALFLLLVVQSAGQLTDDMRKASVVVCADGGMGSGQLIEVDGTRHVITAAHVVRDIGPDGVLGAKATDLTLRTMSGVVATKEIFANTKTDVAILDAANMPADYKPLKLAEKMPESVTILLLTRGGMTAKSSHCHVRFSAISSVDEGRLNVTGWVQSGDSGGAYLNQAGEIVGMVSAGLTPTHGLACDADGDADIAYIGAIGPSVELIHEAFKEMNTSPID